MKTGNRYERFSVACLRCHQNLKFGEFTLSLGREPQTIAKTRAARAARLFMLFQPMILLFCEVFVVVAAVGVSFLDEASFSCFLYAAR